MVAPFLAALRRIVICGIALRSRLAHALPW
jgi:hypothetical protein